jgi:class III poly(R)-hydroxyalkanoic acid synthase PhaE subunit
MDIGGDLFLQMMKHIYPGFADAFFEKYGEWFQKADQNWFAEWPGRHMSNDAGASFKSWMERIQENLANGKPFFDVETQIKMMQSIIQNGNLYVKFMNAVLEATQATFEGQADDEALDEIYNNLTQQYLEYYKQSVGKFLHIPQFGLQRENLHQLMATLDAYHIFMAALGDFLAKFSLPLKNSLEILQQTIKEGEGSGDSFKSAQEIYDFSVNILEKKYDEYLKSPEGVQNVVNVVEKYMDYKKESNRLKDMWFRALSIPTRREMEDIYKGIYDLKKRARKQDAIIREQNELIKALNRKLKKIEGSSK